MKPLCSVLLVASSLLAQSESRTPSLDEIFADVATLRDRVDARAVVVLKARYERNARALSLLERLEESARRGVPVSVPPALRGDPVEGASPELEARERARRDELAARLAAGTSRRGVDLPVLSDRPTVLGSALVGALDVELAAPASRPAPPDAQSERRIRLEAALAALMKIPADRRSPLEIFRAAGLLQELGRTDEAEPLYRLVAERDEGHLREQAQWMLDLARQRRDLRGLVERLGSSKPGEGR